MSRRDDRVSLVDMLIYARDMPPLIEQLETSVREEA